MNTKRRNIYGLSLVSLLLGLLIFGGFIYAVARDSASSAQAAAPGGGASKPFEEPSSPGDWPLYGHDASRTNYNPDETILNSGNVNSMVSRWQMFIGSNGTPASSSPAIANGKAYVGSSASSGNDFFAFDAVTGAQAWATSVNYVGAGCFNVGIGSSPAVSGSILSVGGGDAAYYGLDANSGAQLWRNPMNVGASGFAWESPLLANGRSYLGMSSRCDNPSVRGEIRAVDMNTGNQLANQYFVPAGQAGAGIWQSPALSPDGSTLVVGTGEDYGGYNGIYNRALVSLDPISLAILQSFQEGATGQDLDFGTTPVIFHDNQGRILVGANHKNGIFYTFVLNNLNAGPIWTKSTGTSVGMMPAYDPSFGSGGTLFIAGSSSRIFAVDPATGTDRWPAVTEGSMHGNMAIANGLIFVNLGTTGLRVLNESNGSTIRTIVPANVGSANSGPAVSNGFVYWQSGSYMNAWSLAGTPVPTNTPTITNTPTVTYTPTNTFTSVPTSTFTHTPTPTNAPTDTPVPTNTPQDNLIGHVVWQARPAQPNALQSLPLSLTLRLSGGPAFDFSPTTDNYGFFTVTVGALPNGNYTWRVKGLQNLATTGNVTLTGSDVHTEMGMQPTGDANNDNCDNVQDFGILKTTFGKSLGDPGYDPRADFTGDNSVTVLDFTPLKVNFGQCGVAPILP